MLLLALTKVLVLETKHMQQVLRKHPDDTDAADTEEPQRDSHAEASARIGTRSSADAATASHPQTRARGLAAEDEKARVPRAR